MRGGSLERSEALSAATVGKAPAGVSVNRSAGPRADVPLGVCTLISMTAAVSVGTTAVIMLPETTLNPGAPGLTATFPKNTPVAPVKLVP